MLYMIIEHFKGDPVPVYRRFRDQGRLAPEGLRYLNSWVTNDLQRCYQVMECDDPGLLQQWMDRWKDLVDFEVVSVVTSSDASAAIAPRLECCTGVVPSSNLRYLASSPVQETTVDLDLDQLAQAVLRLPDAARAELATRLLESLDAADTVESPEAIAAAWETELDRREAELVADPSLGIPAEEAFGRLEKDLAAGRTAREIRG